MTTIDTSKLPKYVQDHIRVLEMRLKESKETIAEIEGEAETNIFIRHGTELKPLPANCMIRFQISSGTLNLLIRDNSLEIQATDGILILKTQASNTVLVSVGRF